MQEGIQKNKHKTPAKRYNTYQDRTGFLAKKIVMMAAETGCDVLTIIMPPCEQSDGDSDEEDTKNRTRPSLDQRKKMKPMIIQTSENIMDRFISRGSDYNYFYGKTKLANKIGTLDNRKVHGCLDESGRCDTGDDDESDRIPVRTRKPKPESKSVVDNRHQKQSTSDCDNSGSDDEL